MAFHPDHLNKLVEHFQDWPQPLIEMAEQIECQLLRTNSETARLVSRELVMTVCYHLGGQTIYVPALASVESAIKREEVVGAIESGATTRQIVQDHGITDRTVRNYKKRGRPPKRKEF